MALATPCSVAAVLRPSISAILAVCLPARPFPQGNRSSGGLTISRATAKIASRPRPASGLAPRGCRSHGADSRPATTTVETAISIARFNR